MNRTKGNVIDADQRLYKRPPHIMYRLSKILASEQDYIPATLRQMVLHLRSCEYCQVAVEVMVVASLENSNDETSTMEARRQLQRLKEINHNIQAQNERIAAYTEALLIQGAEEANIRHKAFAEHLKHCQECEDSVEDTRKALIEAVSDGLIPPLKAKAQAKG